MAEGDDDYYDVYDDYYRKTITRKERQDIEAKIANPLTPEEYLAIIHDLLGRVPEFGDAPYDPNYGDDILCVCGHPYYRHFDTYEQMAPVGCKYCPCDTGFQPHPDYDRNFGDMRECECGMPYYRHFEPPGPYRMTKDCFTFREKQV